MTRLLDRMERAGLITRGRHPGDRRMTLIRPTEEASEIFLRAVEVHVRVVDRHFERAAVGDRAGGGPAGAGPA